jgi:hypothetical protein
MAGEGWGSDRDQVGRDDTVSAPAGQADRGIADPGEKSLGGPAKVVYDPPRSEGIYVITDIHEVRLMIMIRTNLKDPVGVSTEAVVRAGV